MVTPESLMPLAGWTIAVMAAFHYTFPFWYWLTIFWRDLFRMLRKREFLPIRVTVFEDCRRTPYYEVPVWIMFFAIFGSFFVSVIWSIVQ